jgi:hypothetical protein
MRRDYRYGSSGPNVNIPSRFSNFGPSNCEHFGAWPDSSPEKEDCAVCGHGIAIHHPIRSNSRHWTHHEKVLAGFPVAIARTTGLQTRCLAVSVRHGGRARHSDENDRHTSRSRKARACWAERSTISAAGGTVGKTTMPFCRSITVKAGLVSSLVRGMIFLPTGYPGRSRRFSLRLSLGVLLRKSHTERRAYDGDACEPNNQGCVVSARNLSDPKQDVTDDQIK